MAEETQVKTYTIPLRKEWRKVANYRRTGRAMKEIKRYIAKHMKIRDRDTTKVKIDSYLNNEIFFRGRKKPPAKIKVRAIKEGDFVKVALAETPDYVKFLKKKHEKIHKESAKEEIPKDRSEEEKKDETTEDKETKQKSESEKEQSVAEQKAKEAKQQLKAQKHTTKIKEPIIRRQALKK